MSNQWYAVPDKSRESWCFLIIDSIRQDGISYVTEWQIGYGNPINFLGSDSYSVESPRRESEVLQSLWNELNSKRYEGMTLITPTNETVKLLRTRLLTNGNIEQASLRGLRHLALADLLEQYFVTEEKFGNLCEIIGEDIRESALVSVAERERLHDLDTKSLWTLRREISFLVPMNALSGSSL